VIVREGRTQGTVAGRIPWSYPQGTVGEKVGDDIKRGNEGLDELAGCREPHFDYR